MTWVENDIFTYFSVTTRKIKYVGCPNISSANLDLILFFLVWNELK